MKNAFLIFLCFINIQLFSQDHIEVKNLNRLLQITKNDSVKFNLGKEVEGMLGTFESKIPMLGKYKVTIENNPNEAFPYNFLVDMPNFSETNFSGLKNELKSKVKLKKLVYTFEIDDEYKNGILIKGENGLAIQILYDEISKRATLYINKFGN